MEQKQTDKMNKAVQASNPKEAVTYRTSFRVKQEDLDQSNKLWATLQAHKATLPEVEKEYRSSDESVWQAHEDLRKAKVTNNPTATKAFQERLGNLETVRFLLKDDFSKKTTELKGQLQTLHTPYERKAQAIIGRLKAQVWEGRKVTFIKEDKNIRSEQTNVTFKSNLETVRNIRNILQESIRWNTLSELVERVAYCEGLVDSEEFVEGTQYVLPQDQYREVADSMPNPMAIREAETLTGGIMTAESLEIASKAYQAKIKVDIVNAEKGDSPHWIGH